MKIKVRVYACRHTDIISTNPNDFIPVAIEENDLYSFTEFMKDEYFGGLLIERFELGETEEKTCHEVLEELRAEYDQHLEKEIKHLFTHCTDCYWCNDIEINVDNALLELNENCTFISRAVE